MRTKTAIKAGLAAIGTYALLSIPTIGISKMNSGGENLKHGLSSQSLQECWLIK